APPRSCRGRPAANLETRMSVRRARRPGPTLGGPMPRISTQEFERLPLRVHDFLAGVPLHDAWVVDLPRIRSGITLEEFLRVAGAAGPPCRPRAGGGRAPSETPFFPRVASWLGTASRTHRGGNP